MKLFILIDKLPFFKRLALAFAFLNSGITILLGRNISFSFKTTLKIKNYHRIVDVNQLTIPKNEATVILSKNNKIVNL